MVHSRGHPCAARFRLQGLLTLVAACSHRTRAGLISSRQRSWDLPFRAFPSNRVIGAFPPDRACVPFLLPVHHPGCPGGPAREAAASRFWPLPECLAPDRVISAAVAGGSPGLHPSRALQTRPSPVPPPAPSHALRDSTPGGAETRAPQSLNQPHPGPTRPFAIWNDRGSGDPQRVPAPARSRAFARAALRAMCSPHVASYITADRPTH